MPTFPEECRFRRPFMRMRADDLPQFAIPTDGAEQGRGREIKFSGRKVRREDRETERLRWSGETDRQTDRQREERETRRPIDRDGHSTDVQICHVSVQDRDAHKTSQCQHECRRVPCQHCTGECKVATRLG